MLIPATARTTTDDKTRANLLLRSAGEGAELRARGSMRGVDEPEPPALPVPPARGAVAGSAGLAGGAGGAAGPLSAGSATEYPRPVAKALATQRHPEESNGSCSYRSAAVSRSAASTPTPWDMRSSIAAATPRLDAAARSLCSRRSVSDGMRSLNLLDRLFSSASADEPNAATTSRSAPTARPSGSQFPPSSPELT